MLKEKAGEVAGIIWKALRDSNGLTLEQVKAHAPEPEEHVLLALGWLLREDKIVCEDDKFTLK